MGCTVFADLVRIQTRDGVRLEGMLQMPQGATSSLDVDVACFVHGTGGNFYSSTMFDALGEGLLSRGCAVLRVNTRGHDVISNAVTSKGGQRLGAAYEVMDDCRHDLTAWIDLLKQRFGTRIALVGHSSGAVKCIYALAHEIQLRADRLVAISPPRLSYSWFCGSAQAVEFLEFHRRAENEVAQGRATALLEVDFPLPFVITAAGYLEKYGPDERYDYLKLIGSVRCPILVTFGSIEVEKNVAFAQSPEALEQLRQRHPHIESTTIQGADHFYTAVREDLVETVAHWLSKK
jgi:pimeloyl-ACP methyl ester carboxylesterase